MLGEWFIADRDFGIALRSQVPDGSGVLDQERKVVLIEHRQYCARIRTDQVPHACVEPVVHMGQHEIEVRFTGADPLDKSDPIRLLTLRQTGAVIQERP